MFLMSISKLIFYSTLINSSLYLLVSIVTYSLVLLVDTIRVYLVSSSLVRCPIKSNSSIRSVISLIGAEDLLLCKVMHFYSTSLAISVKKFIRSTIPFGSAIYLLDLYLVLIPVTSLLSSLSNSCIIC